MEFTDLSRTSLDVLHDAFVDAFSDYVIPFQLSREQLAAMLERRGYDSALSVGAFDAGRLVAFTLNGIGSHMGLSTAYDTGTGVRPAHRGRRLTRAMFAWALERLGAEGIVQYLLEAITTNEKAVVIYRKLGFETVREFQCWQVSASEGSVIAPEWLRIQSATAVDWHQAGSFCDVFPSWQNSTASILRSRDRRTILHAEVDGQFVGFAALFPESGDLPQLAVHRDARLRGIGRSLLLHAARLSESGTLRVINVDDSSPGPNTFLRKLGARSTVRQFEMRRIIRSD